MSNKDLISVIDLAVQHGLRKQSVFRVLKRQGIEPKRRIGSNSRGQLIAYISQEEAEVVLGILGSNRSEEILEVTSNILSDAILAERGVFYLIQLEPKSDPGRFKVGFAGTLPERLRQLRCSAPFIQVLATWPCKRLWEKTAIDSVTAGCERLHTEVFRTESVENIREKCIRFFAIMPSLK